jgi:hypothetical protein
MVDGDVQLSIDAETATFFCHFVRGEARRAQTSSRGAPP